MERERSVTKAVSGIKYHIFFTSRSTAFFSGSAKTENSHSAKRLINKSNVNAASVNDSEIK